MEGIKETDSAFQFIDTEKMLKWGLGSQSDLSNDYKCLCPMRV